MKLNRMRKIAEEKIAAAEADKLEQTTKLKEELEKALADTEKHKKLRRDQAEASFKKIQDDAEFYGDKIKQHIKKADESNQREVELEIKVRNANRYLKYAREDAKYAKEAAGRPSGSAFQGAGREPDPPHQGES